MARRCYRFGRAGALRELIRRSFWFACCRGHCRRACPLPPLLCCFTANCASRAGRRQLHRICHNIHYAKERGSCRLRARMARAVKRCRKGGGGRAPGCALRGANGASLWRKKPSDGPAGNGIVGFIGGTVTPTLRAWRRRGGDPRWLVKLALSGGPRARAQSKSAVGRARARCPSPSGRLDQPFPVGPLPRARACWR
jgi:hypothetical protein